MATPVRSVSSTTWSTGDATKASRFNEMRTDILTAFTEYDYGDTVDLPGSPTLGQSFMDKQAGVLYAAFSAGTWTPVVGAAGILPTGTTVSSILRWSGTSWVEETDFLVDAAGAVTATGLTLSGNADLGGNSLTNAKLTAPQFNDTSADHQYILGVSELAADRTITLPLLTGNDTFVFEAHSQTLTNKTLTAPQINGVVTTTGLTMPAFTLGGTVSMDGQTISGAVVFDNALSGITNLGMSGNLTLGADVVLSRGAANRLDLASGDSLNLVSGGYQIAGSTVISSGQLLTLTGTGPHAIGGAAQTFNGIRLAGVPSAVVSGSASTIVNPDGVTAAVNGDYAVFRVEIQSITEAASGTHGNIDGAFIRPPTIVNGGATTTTASTLRIPGAPTGATNNWALLVGGGASGFPDGSASAPSISFGSDPDTGIFRGGANDVRIATAGSTQFTVTSGAIGTPSGNRLHLDGGGGGDTYFIESSANTLRATVGGSSSSWWTATQFIIPSGNKLHFDGDTAGDTWIYEVSANNLAFVAGNNTALNIVPRSTVADLYLRATGRLYLDDGGDSYITEPGANVIRIVTAGASAAEATAAGNWYCYNNLFVAGHGTTASAANAFLDSGDNGKLLRSTSSRRYKTAIEDCVLAEAYRTISALRPITYRGKNDSGDREWFGFVAEEVAAVDPRLATYVDPGALSANDRRDAFVVDGLGAADYVTYDRVAVPLLAVVQDLMRRVAELEGR